MTEQVTEEEFAPIEEWIIQLCEIDIDAAIWLAEYASTNAMPLDWWKQESLLHMIEWSKTPQGGDYWAKIDNKMNKRSKRYEY